MSDGRGSEAVRASVLRSLGKSHVFDVPEAILIDHLSSTSSEQHPRLCDMEARLVAFFSTGSAIPPDHRPAALPVLGNVAEAVFETLLIDHGWTPTFHDHAPASSNHGVDLLMLDPQMDRVVAVEVKSTIQKSRWPRLARPRSSAPQLSAEWLDSSGNAGMQDWDLTADDVYLMVAQVHLGRRQWRACIGASARFTPISSMEQLGDLSWLDSSQN